jgi:hypothetical protein
MFSNIYDLSRADCSFVPYSLTSSAYIISLMCSPIPHLQIKQEILVQRAIKFVFLCSQRQKESSLRNGSKHLIQFSSNYQRLLVCLNLPNGIFQRKVEKQW